jgi:hypothetical protein
MWWHRPSAAIAAACVSLLARDALAEATNEPTAAPQNAPSETAVAPTGETEIIRVATGKGFIFHPSEPQGGKFRFAVGGQYDAVDPAVMYGMNYRLPRVTVDARLGLGDGWSLKGHFDSMLVTTELLLGGAYGWHSGRWSLEGAASVGILFGKLNQVGFDSVFIAPQYRPEVTLGYEIAEGVSISLRGSLLLAGPTQARVGDTWGGFDNSNIFVGHGEMLFVENTTTKGSVWYFAFGAYTTRAYYQLWLLFPDSPGLYTYARVAAGYEF